MKINESTFRKILREEARRVLTEAPAGVPTAAGTTAAPVVGGNIMGGPTQGPQTPEVAAATAGYKKNVMQGLQGLKVNIQKLLESVSAQPVANAAIPSMTKAFGMLNTFNDLDSNGSQVLAGALLNAAQKAPGSENDKALAVVATLALGKNPDPMDWYRYLVDVGIPLDQTAATYKVNTIDKADTMSQYSRNQAATAYVGFVKALAREIVANAGMLASNFQQYKKSATARPAPALTKTGKPYAVVKGDTVAAIAQKFYGITPSNSAMAAYQQIVGQGNNPNAIKIGQQLSLPPQLAVGQKVYNLKVPVA